MLEKVLQTILRRYFGQFIAGLENVQLAFWTGKINIQNASFRHQKINEMLKLKHIPLSIKFSFLGSLQLDIPWNKLSSAPVEIKISNVHVVFALEKLTDHLPNEQSLEENAKILLIKNYLAYILKKSEELKSEGQGESGFLKKLMLKVLHNVNIQINNVHVRIQSGSPYQSILEPEPGQELFYSCLDQNDKPIGFSMGLCIENVEAQTINEKGEKQYVQITSNKTPIRKTINLKQISLYWEEEEKFNLLSYSKERRVEILKEIIGRNEHRLLTIDGSLLMQKNKDCFDYFFSTSFRVLQVKMNYLQLKQIIQVVQQFANAKTKKKIIKMKEIKHELQLKLEPAYRQIFNNLYLTKFEKVQPEDIKIIDKIDKKLLMKWTKQECVQLIKNQKLKTAVQSKNKKTWLSFLSKNSQLELTEDQIKAVDEEITKFVQLVDQKQTQISFGIQLTIAAISVLMQHRLYSQKMLFLSEEISLDISSVKQHLKLTLTVLDISLNYEDLQKRSGVSIFKKTTAKQQRILHVQLLNDKKIQKLNVKIQQFCITHEIQFLGFISEMINLQQREEGKVKIMLLQAEAINNKNPESNAQEVVVKIYDYNVHLKKMQIKLELDNASQIYSYIQAINIQKNTQSVNSHAATLTNFGLTYIHSQSPQKSNQIIEDINITVSLVGLKQLHSIIPKIRIVLNEECLYSISNCLKKQYKMLQMRKLEYKRQLIQEQEKIMEGQTQSINMFKSLKIYHTVLTSDKLIFYQQQPGNSKIDLSQPSKTILLHNLSISRRDDFSFKLQSKMIMNQIIHCKSKEDTDQWLYLIEQRIYQSSSKQQIFSMADQDNQQKDSQPHIYIPYDSTIDLSVHFFQVILQKNTKDKILSINLNSLNILLKENNLQFERKVNLQQICIKNLSLVDQPRDQYNTILSNTINYFQDPDSDSESERLKPSNITVTIEGKKKTHPKYTGQISIKSSINRLFINYNAQFIFSLIYRFTFGDQQSKPFPEAIRNAKVIEILKQILEDSKNIPQKYLNAKPFQFSRSFIQLEKYRQIYSCNVLFHVELAIQQIQMYIINGRSNLWLEKVFMDGVFLQVDKSTQFIFAKGRCRDLSISDLTGYPKTSRQPFTQAEPYPLLETHRKQPHAVVFSAGLFEPLVFINKERFKNFFELTFNDLTINYQQQPFMRLVDTLINQIVMFALEPFSLHKFDTPNRGSYAFGAINFTQKQIRKILRQSVYPFYTHLRIHANRLTVNFNSHPHQQAIQFFISSVKLISAPYINNQRAHVKLDIIKQFQKDYKTLQEIRQKQDVFQNLVSKFQWTTRYLINLDECKCDIFQNTFNYEMYFERVNNGDKDILLPFLKIDKDLLMEGRIKNLNLTASKRIYNLINKCFNFNLSYDDGCESLYNTNHQFEHLNPKSKLIYRLFINQLSYLIPELDRTVFVIPNCEYKFQKEQNNTKNMEVLGRSLHIFDTKEKSYLIKPVQFDEPIGFMFGIGMSPSGEKKMYVSLKQIELTYLQEYIMSLIKYFILDDSCNPKQQHYPDVPLIRCQADILNSYIKIAQYQDYVFALKGSIRVIWTRNKNTHPQVYKQNKDLYPNNSEANSYDIELKGANLCKYNKKQFEKKSNIFRPLSTLIICKIKLTNIMKRCNDIFYTDMHVDYNFQKMQLKVCYKDVIELQECFKPEDARQSIEPRNSRRKSIQQKQPYVSHSKHSLQIKHFSLQMGLSQLPVPLLDLSLHNSTIKVQLLGTTKIFTSVLEITVNYWNMLIGRWQPLLQVAKLEVILRFAKQNYYSIQSNRPLLLNFSIQSLKVLKLLSNDFAEKGNMRMLSHQNKLKDIHVSPYAITNRTGYNIFMDNLAFDLAINSNKLKNNDTMHIRNKNGQIQQTFDKVKYQIEGDAKEHELYLNIVQAESTNIQYNGLNYEIIYQVISSPILKQIVISSPFIIHNKTTFKLILSIGTNDFVVDIDKKIPVPFTQNPRESKSIKITFPHLKQLKQNFAFTFQDIERTNGYDHCIIYGQNQSFYCCFQLEVAQQYIISISPLTTLINLIPLPIKMQIALTQHRGDQIFINQTLQINKTKILYQFGCRDSVSARIVVKGFNISSLQNLGLIKDKSQIAMSQNDERLILSDHRGLESYIKTKINKKHKKKSMYFYTECVLINQSSYHIYLFSGTQLIPGQSLKNVPESQSKYIFINDVKELSIGFKDDDPSLTQKLSLQSLGNQYLSVAHHDSLYELVVHSSVHCVDQEMQLFTRLLKLTPRYILINECTRGICFRQINTDQRAYLRIKQRFDWHWHSKDQTRQLTVTASDNQFELADGWDFSAPFQLQNLQEMVFVLRPKVKSPHRLLLKVQIIKELQFTYLIFKQLKNPEDSLITIKNNMRQVRLEVSQQMLTGITPSWADFKHFQCPPSQQIMFGWDFPSDEHTIDVRFNFLGAYRTKYEDNVAQIDVAKFNKPIIIEFIGDEAQNLQIEVSLEIVGIRRKLIFQNKDESEASRLNDEQLGQMSGSKMGLSLSQIGISIIGGRKPRCQIIFISIKKLEVIMMQKQYKRNYQLKIKYINIDNNLNHNTMFPVLFTPLYERKTLQKNRPFFICLVEQNLKSEQIMEINYFRMAMEPISFKLYDQIITKLYDMQKEFSTLTEKQKKIDLCQTFRSEEKLLEWQSKEPSKSDKSIFLREVQIGKIIIQLSFSIKPTSGGNIILYTIVTLFKTVMSNVSQSQIKLSRFIRKNISMGDLSNQLSEFYRKEVFKQIYKIPGSINILGNPYVFVKYMAEGVWEIINQPSQGFIKGPIEGAIGVFKGGIYCSRNIIAGTFNSLQVISQSCSQGISYVTFDEKFMTRRQKIQMQKSKHIGEGTKSALFALYTGVQIAITGLYRLPKQNYNKSGTPGFFKGVVLGIAGLFTKPLSGLFQGISKFSQGIKQTALFSQDGPNSTRSRPPRVFIGNQQFYTQYSLQESKAINLLEFHSTKHLNKNIMFVSADKNPEDEKDYFYTVLTNQYLVLLNKNKKKILREVRIEDINQVDPRNNERQNKLIIKFGDDQSLSISSHKSAQLYQCFKMLFDNIPRNDQNSEDEEGESK